MGRNDLNAVQAARWALASIAVLAGGPALAGFSLDWHSTSGSGGGTSSGGVYSIVGTVGLADAGSESGGGYSVNGGFWTAAGGSYVVGVGDAPGQGAAAPLALRLHPAVPNPLMEGTRVAFDLPSAQAVQLRLYDVTGRMRRTLASGAFAAGRSEVWWDGREDSGRRMGSGIYFVKLEAGGVKLVEKVVVGR